MRTDVSNMAVGCALMHSCEGVMYPVAYTSRKLNEKKYSVEEKGCVGLIWEGGTKV